MKTHVWCSQKKKKIDCLQWIEDIFFLFVFCVCLRQWAIYQHDDKRCTCQCHVPSAPFAVVCTYQKNVVGSWFHTCPRFDSKLWCACVEHHTQMCTPHSKWGQMYLCVFKIYDKVHTALPTSKWANELMKRQLCQCLSILESLLWMPWCTQVWGVHIQDEGETSYIKNMLNLPFYTTEFTELYMLQYWQTA